MPQQGQRFRRWRRQGQSQVWLFDQLMRTIGRGKEHQLEAILMARSTLCQLPRTVAIAKRSACRRSNRGDTHPLCHPTASTASGQALPSGRPRLRLGPAAPSSAPARLSSPRCVLPGPAIGRPKPSSHWAHGCANELGKIASETTC